MIIVSFAIGIFYYQNTAVCRQPLTYDIGTFDTRFNISENKFLINIKEAEKIWETGLGQDLFDYEPGGKLKINLIFDERQQKTVEAVGSKQNIESNRKSYDALLREYKLTEASYKKELASYDSASAELETRLDNYNSQVAEINKKGGATPQEYKELEQEKKYLEAKKTELDSWRLRLNDEALRLNSAGDQVNNLAKELNINVDIHNERFGTAREFDQGDYINNTINIYEFESISDLRLVLAHELGHALDLGHVENSKSIMYYLLGDQNINSPALSAEDIAAFRSRCSAHIPKLQELFN